MSDTKQKAVFATLSLPMEVTDEQIRNLLISLFEGGYSSWFRKVVKMVYGEGISKVDFEVGGKFHDPEYTGGNMCYVVTMTPGCGTVIKIEDPNNGGFTEFTLTRENMLVGLTKLLEKHSHHVQDIIDGNDDAETADMFGQFTVYGENVYG